jgi:hypothetical protein
MSLANLPTGRLVVSLRRENEKSFRLVDDWYIVIRRHDDRPFVDFVKLTPELTPYYHLRRADPYVGFGMSEFREMCQLVICRPERGPMQREHNIGPFHRIVLRYEDVAGRRRFDGVTLQLLEPKILSRDAPAELSEHVVGVLFASWPEISEAIVASEKPEERRMSPSFKHSIDACRCVRSRDKP